MLTTDFVTGAPSWLDLASSDGAAAADFYTAVFGWTFQSAGPEGAGYGYFFKDGKTVAALTPIMEEGAAPAWTVYFQTQDADTAAKAVEQAGGTVRIAPFDVMTAGRMAHLSDPGGAAFAVWQPAAVQGLEKVCEFNALFWVELHHSDLPGALSFYGSLFDWRAKQKETPGLEYHVLSTAEGDQDTASFGGLTTAQNGMAPRWMPYFGSGDTDAVVAKVKENGGTVLLPPMDVPGVGRVSWVLDPSGAPFAILKPAA